MKARFNIEKMYKAMRFMDVIALCIMALWFSYELATSRDTFWLAVLLMAMAFNVFSIVYQPGKRLTDLMFSKVRKVK